MNKSFTPDFDGTSSVGDAIIVPMERLRRKGPGMAAAEAAWLGIQHVIEDNTTLNQVYDILPDVRHVFGQDKYKCGYFSLGINGYKAGVGEGGRPKKTTYQSKPQDLQLFLPIPISLRPYSNQLTADEARDLRLKTTLNHKGVDYIAYYARTLDSTESVAKTYMRKTGETAKEYVYDSTALTPKPTLPPAVGEVVNIVANMVVLTSVKAHLTAFDVAEIKNACVILYGEPEDISEIAFIQAAEREVVDTDQSGTSYNRKELIDAQVGMSGVTSIPVAYTTSAIPAEYRLGASEPLYTSLAE